MRKKIIVAILFLFLLFIGIALWLNTRESIEGYVYSSEDSLIWVIGLEEDKIKDEKDIIKLLDEKAGESEGIVFEEPFLNRITRTSEFKEGQKVKVFWPGGEFQSAPSLVEDTFVIFKMEN